MDTHTFNNWLSTEDINAPLRRMVGSDVCLSGDWTINQFMVGRGDGLGTWRVSGTMISPVGEQPWSMVLKGWSFKGKSGSPSEFDWPWREAELYGEGALHDLPGISAPVCYGTVEQASSVWVWLEDLTAAPQVPWTLQRYGEAARNLGRFNGSYLAGKPLPTHQSLSHRWLAGLTAAGTDTISSLDEYLDHPIVAHMFPPEVLAAYYRIWDHRHSILDRLHSVPQAFCHLDAFHQNTFFRAQNGIEEMLLIDWSFAGLAAPGEELVALCIAGAVFDPASFDKLNEIERISFDSYINGLCDAGWQGAEEEIWWAYRSAAILRYGPAILRPLLPVVMNEEACRGMASAMGVSFDGIRDHLARLCRWIANHAEDV